MDTTSQWTQDIRLVTSNMTAQITPPNVTCSRTSSTIMEKKVRPLKDQAINCPRCNSTNTKFCYYNNYSLTQPRYFCKTCRRYWTEGGTLRNVPVGGGSRKNRRCSSSSSSSLSSSQKLLELNPNPSLSSLQNPNYNLNLGSNQDLNLGFPYINMHDHNNYFRGVPQFLEFPKMDKGNSGIDQFSTSTSNTTPISALDLLRTGIASRGLSAFISSSSSSSPPDLNVLYTSSGVQENGAKMIFPFGCLNKQFSGENHHNNNSESKGQENSSSAGYWNDRMLGGGGSW